MDKSLALDVCLALRQGREEDARQGFGQIMAVADAPLWLALAEDVLLGALRCRRQDLFAQWYAEAGKHFCRLMAQGDLAEAGRQWLLAVAFAVCDRREVEPQLLREPARAWLRKYGATSSADNFWSEWLNLAARMARRGWRSQTTLLLEIVLWGAVRHNDIKFWQNILGQLGLHFTVYARWDGFPNACAAYPELQLLYLLLVRRAGKAGVGPALQVAYLQLALRSIRDMVANVSRSTMVDDMDIFRQWYQYLWQMAGEDKQRKGRLRLLWQLAIRYWQGTRPKTSRKQVRYLQDLLEPSAITTAYEKLLQSVI